MQKDKDIAVRGHSRPHRARRHGAGGAGSLSNSNQHVKQRFDQREAAAARLEQSSGAMSLRAGLALRIDPVHGQSRRNNHSLCRPCTVSMRRCFTPSTFNHFFLSIEKRKL
jgi:hypothetical protein